MRRVVNPAARASPSANPVAPRPDAFGPGRSPVRGERVVEGEGVRRGAVGVEVLQQVAKALRISAETLYVRAGILDAERDRDEVETRAVILADPTLNERQKQVLLQIYESFRKENGFEVASADEAAPGVEAPGTGISGAQDVPDTQPSQDTAVRGPRTADGSDAGPQQTAS